MKRGRADRVAAGLPSWFKARRSTNWLMTVLTVNKTSRSLRGISLSKKRDGIVGPVRLEQVGVLVTERPKRLLEQERNFLARNRVDARITRDIAVGPVAEQRSPMPGFDVFDYDS